MPKDKPKSNSKKRQIRVRFGDIFKIDLGDGTHCYAHTGKSALFIFYDYNGSEELSLPEIVSKSAIFKIHVDDYVPRTENWERIGNVQSKILDIEPYFFVYDIIGKYYQLYHSDFKETNWMKRVERSEVEGLERCASWAENHIEDRLRDHYAGRSCKWVSPIDNAR